MAGTTSELCICRRQELPALVAAWRDRIQPVLAHAVDNGRPINQRKLALSAKLVSGISTNDPAAFDERYRDLSHHMMDCPCACPSDQTALALLS